MDNVREKLVELLTENCHFGQNCIGDCAGCLVDHLIANGVTVQKTAHWDEGLNAGVGNYLGFCSNCHTQHKAQSYAALVAGHRYCNWCGAKMMPTPPKGE